MPQAPQFCESIAVFTQLPLHTESPALQLTPHWLSVHVATPPMIGGHILLQPPQLAASERGSMQAVPQRMNGLMHWKSHFPPLHTGAAFAGALHTMPHAPQLEVSVLVSTQEDPHVVLLPQSVLHVPLWHTLPLGQTVAQAPQCAGSELSSTHLPLQLA